MGKAVLRLSSRAGGIVYAGQGAAVAPLQQLLVDHRDLGFQFVQFFAELRERLGQLGIGAGNQLDCPLLRRHPPRVQGIQSRRPVGLNRQHMPAPQLDRRLLQPVALALGRGDGVLQPVQALVVIRDQGRQALLGQAGQALARGLSCYVRTLGCRQ